MMKRKVHFHSFYSLLPHSFFHYLPDPFFYSKLFGPRAYLVRHCADPGLYTGDPEARTLPEELPGQWRGPSRGISRHMDLPLGVSASARQGEAWVWGAQSKVVVRRPQVTSCVEACGMRGQGGLVAMAVWLGGGERGQPGRRMLEQAVHLDFILRVVGSPRRGLSRRDVTYPHRLAKTGRAFQSPCPDGRSSCQRFSKASLCP